MVMHGPHRSSFNKTPGTLEGNLCNTVRGCQGNLLSITSHCLLSHATLFCSSAADWKRCNNMAFFVQGVIETAVATARAIQPCFWFPFKSESWECLECPGMEWIPHFSLYYSLFSFWCENKKFTIFREFEWLKCRTYVAGFWWGHTSLSRRRWYAKSVSYLINLCRKNTPTQRPPPGSGVHYAGVQGFDTSGVSLLQGL